MVNLFTLFRAPYTATVSAIAHLDLAINSANYCIGRAMVTQKGC